MLSTWIVSIGSNPFLEAEYDRGLVGYFSPGPF